ncbi:MAG: hypothetical protein KGH65_03235 [Candidatus Micrarchaeota archaeon]|nr:hypothetical protein [Candidatus Micrarchaeota archaeon]
MNLNLLGTPKNLSVKELKRQTLEMEAEEIFNNKDPLASWSVQMDL